jgi:hypothetical protein
MITSHELARTKELYRDHSVANALVRAQGRLGEPAAGGLEGRAKSRGSLALAQCGYFLGIHCCSVDRHPVFVRKTSYFKAV